MDDPSVILQRFMTLHPKKMDLSLGRIERLLERLGNPHRQLPPVVHVAGTNGKGSTIAFLRAMLEAGRQRVHVYTSPHLVRFNERIRLADGPSGGRLVDDATLVEALMRAEEANAGDPITFFEITTAAAFILFSEHPADFLLLEVGLGGRLDATNVVERPAATAITPVSFDHLQFLGNTIETIAAEKAGIIKRGVPCIVSRQSKDGLGVIERAAARMRAPLSVLGEDWFVHEEHARLVFQDENGLLDLPVPRLPGRHQFENAGTAIALFRRLAEDGFEIGGEQALAQGIANAVWPARMQRLTGPLAAAAPEGSEVWLDGAHNADGARVLAAAMAELEEKVPRPLVLIAAMLESKAADAFLANFVDLARRVYCVPMTTHDAPLAPASLAAMARSVGLEGVACPDLDAALAAIRSAQWEVPPRILITGSLYFSGEILAREGATPQ